MCVSNQDYTKMETIQESRTALVARKSLSFVYVF